MFDWLVFIILFVEAAFTISTSGETYEMQNDVVVRPFKTHHLIPSQVGWDLDIDVYQYAMSFNIKKLKAWNSYDPKHEAAWICSGLCHLLTQKKNLESSTFIWKGSKSRDWRSLVSRFVSYCIKVFIFLRY